jgi:tellurite resistance protein
MTRTRRRSQTTAGAGDKLHSAVTPAYFGIALGFAGLSGTWRIAAHSHHPASYVANATAGISAFLALILAIGWVTTLVATDSTVLAQVRDPVIGPSVPVIAITAMVLSSALLSVASSVARVLVVVFGLTTLAAGLTVVVSWTTGRLPLRAYHPGFYLPTVGGTMLTAQSLTDIGWTGFAQTLFFIGIGAWLVLGLLTTLRLARGPALASGLIPILVMEIAAPALASNTYLVVFDRWDTYANVLTWATIVMGIVQLALIPTYRRAWFAPSFWTSAFTYATVASLALRWITHEAPAGAIVWQAVVLGLVSLLVVVLTIRTGQALRQRTFLPHRDSWTNGVSPDSPIVSPARRT